MMRTASDVGIIQHSAMRALPAPRSRSFARQQARRPCGASRSSWRASLSPSTHSSQRDDERVISIPAKENHCSTMAPRTPSGTHTGTGCTQRSAGGARMVAANYYDLPAQMKRDQKMADEGKAIDRGEGGKRVPPAARTCASSASAVRTTRITCVHCHRAGRTTSSASRIATTATRLPTLRSCDHRCPSSHGLTRAAPRPSTAWMARGCRQMPSRR